PFPGGREGGWWEAWRASFTLSARTGRCKRIVARIVAPRGTMPSAARRLRALVLRGAVPLGSLPGNRHGSGATAMRHLAIGDVHGCLTALRRLAEFVPFDPGEDVLVTLGDYVDRGPDSRGVLDWLIAYKGKGKLVPLRGNHEVMMLAARDGDEA